MSESDQDLHARGLMTKTLVTISADCKMDDAAALMQRHHVNALPVLSEEGRCLGILTSHNVVEYEAIRDEIENEYQHGYFFDLARYGIEPRSRFSEIRYDEVGYHMSRKIDWVEIDATANEMIELLCRSRNHHVLVKDASGKLAGIVSVLDLISGLLPILKEHDVATRSG